MRFPEADKIGHGEIAIFAAEKLFDELTVTEGFDAFEVIAGFHGEILRRMLVLLGYEKSEKYLRISLETIKELAKEAALDPATRLLHATPSGSA